MTELNDLNLEQVNGGTSYFSGNEACELFEPVPDAKRTDVCRSCRFFVRFDFPPAPKCDGRCMYSSIIREETENGN